MLKFIGRGSAFSDEHNCAYFEYGQELVLLDCPMSAFHVLKKCNLSQFNEITILITHTHGDHIGGVAMLIDYEHFVTHIPVTVLAPSRETALELENYLINLEGCNRDWFTIATPDVFDKPYLTATVPTEHAESLAGKCFGYILNSDDTTMIYTGDTRTYKPFEKYLSAGSILYTEIAANKSDVHLYVNDIKETVKKYVSEGIKVYLMHMDDEEKILSLMADTGAKPAPYGMPNNSMTDNPAKLLGEIFNIGDKLYKEMCSKEDNSHGSLFSYITELGKTIVGADRASFWKWDRNKHILWTASASGVDKIVIPDDTGLVGKAIKTKQVIVTNNPYDDPDFNREVDKKTGYVTKSILVLPVANLYGECIGAFQLINKNNDMPFDVNEDARKLSLAALVCGIALESETFLEDSHHDKLTKLRNRMGFHSDFAKTYSKYLRPDSTEPLSMFISDIDRFKLVNDTYGHNAGDDVLSYIAALLQNECEENDTIYRWGGEEFIMIMQNTTLEECTRKADSIRNKIMNSTINADGNEIKCTMSFGCEQFMPGTSWEETVSTADSYLYKAKESGRNKVINKYSN